MTNSRIARYLNHRSEDEARHALQRCCGSRRWIAEMLAERPFVVDEEVFSAADRIWQSLAPDDWLEAFSHHPRLGERRIEAAAPESTREWSRREQDGAAEASQATQDALAAGNADYERRFGHVFLLCATGKSGEEMLAELQHRLDQEPAAELVTAAGEQAKITRLRLAKLVEETSRRDS